jgi:DNA-binding NtrC family response regulator
VDDDEFILQATGFVLSHLGYMPVLAKTGEEAMAILLAGLEPVLVILDLDMPGMGGAATLPLIRTLRPGLPVVIATGRLAHEAAELACKFPLVSLMPKPYGLREMRQQLDTASQVEVSRCSDGMARPCPS